MRRAKRSVARVGAVVLPAVLAAGLAACSGGDPAAAPSSSASAGTTASATASGPPDGVTTYLPVPAGVSLTSEGSALSVGDQAVVAWKPTQNLVGVLDLTVTALERTTIKDSFSDWELPKELADATPYFVQVKATNAGATSLGGRAVPLYAQTDTDTLVEASSFQGRYRPCPSAGLPGTFAPGDRASLCLVYLLPHGGTLSAMSFRPTEDFAPITWTGDVEPYAPPSASPSAKGGKAGRGGKAAS